MTRAAGAGPPRSGRTRAVPQRLVTWVELFFDLVYVFVITQVAALLRTDQSAAGVLQAVVVFVPIYWAWVGTSIYADTHEVDALVDRLGLFVVGLASLIMAMAVPGAYGNRGVLLGASYLAARLVLAALALRGPFRAVPLNPYTIALVVTGPLVFIGGFLTGPARVTLWFIAAATDLLAPRLTRRGLARIPFDPAHLPERFGLFFIIALGDSIVAVGAVAAALPLTPLRLLAVAGAYGLVFGLWWVYFHLAASAIRQAMEEAPAPTEVMRPALTYGHLIFIASVVAVAVGLAEVVAEPAMPLHDGAAGLLCGGVGLYLATFAYTRWRLYRRISYTRLGGAALSIAIIAVATMLPAVIAVLLLALVVVVVNVAEVGRFLQFGPNLDL
jgi:low temperature requirement protein LtrA